MRVLFLDFTTAGFLALPGLPFSSSIILCLSSRHRASFPIKEYMSCVMRKPTFCICENKGADQLHGNRAADQHLCFRYIDSTIPLLHTYFQAFRHLEFFCDCTAQFASGLVGNPEQVFLVVAHIFYCTLNNCIRDPTMSLKIVKCSSIP